MPNMPISTAVLCSTPACVASQVYHGTVTSSLLSPRRLRVAGSGGRYSITLTRNNGAEPYSTAQHSTDPSTQSQSQGSAL